MNTWTKTCCPGGFVLIHPSCGHATSWLWLKNMAPTWHPQMEPRLKPACCSRASWSQVVIPLLRKKLSVLGQHSQRGHFVLLTSPLDEDMWLRRIQKAGSPKWVARSVSGNMGTKTCGLPLLVNFEPHLCKQHCTSWPPMADILVQVATDNLLCPGP